MFTPNLWATPRHSSDGEDETVEVGSARRRRTRAASARSVPTGGAPTGTRAASASTYRFTSCSLIGHLHGAARGCRDPRRAGREHGRTGSSRSRSGCPHDSCGLGLGQLQVDPEDHHLPLLGCQHGKRRPDRLGAVDLSLRPGRGPVGQHGHGPLPRPAPAPGLVQRAAEEDSRPDQRRPAGTGEGREVRMCQVAHTLTMTEEAGSVPANGRSVTARPDG